MAELGADYSWARPGGAALAAAGVKAVGRYLAADGRGITAVEYQDLRAHGIDVWLVREGSANGMLNGFQQGVADAQIAVQQIAAVGLPSNSVVHTAADWDVQTSQFPACDAYQDGFASVLGGYNRVGAYGGLHWLNHAHAAGKAVSFWQAGATSWNHGEAPQMPIQFVQTTNPPPLPGTDHNYINDAGLAFLSATPITNSQEEDDMIPTIRDGNGSGSVYSIADDLTIDGLSGDEVSAGTLAGVLKPWVQAPDGLAVQILARRTARLRAAQHGDCG
jgi:hypothetical protein